MSTVLVPDLHQGTVYSTPLAWPAGKLGVTAGGLLSDSDGGDPAKTLTLGLEVSFDGGMTYQQSAQATWQGGSLPRGATAGPPWALPLLMTGFSSSQTVPTHARVRLELPAVLSVGATLSFS